MQVVTKKQFKSGTKVELDGKRYIVKSSVDLKWIGLSSKALYSTQLELVY